MRSLPTLGKVPGPISSWIRGRLRALSAERVEGEAACANWSDCCAPAVVAPSAADTPLAAPSAVMFCRKRRRLADFFITDLLPHLTIAHCGESSGWAQLKGGDSWLCMFPSRD